MIYTIDKLLNENNKVFEYYQLAKTEWKKILINEEYKNSDSLSKRLSEAQFWFESNCGDKRLGQEIMVITGIAQFYDLHIGFEATNKKALFIYEAFTRSYCSMEVKFLVSKIAIQYGLIERGRHDY